MSVLDGGGEVVGHSMLPLWPTKPHYIDAQRTPWVQDKMTMRCHNIEAPFGASFFARLFAVMSRACR